MNTRNPRVKPITVAIASVLCLGLSGGVAAKTASAKTPATSAVAKAQSTAQSDQTTGEATDRNNKSKRKPSDAEKQAIKLQTITVTGIAGSQQRDLILKRYAPQIEDSITAVNIGQLPDTTITDSLSRIPGVQISRSGGEGTAITVRGLPQVAQTLNDETFLSADGLVSGQPDFIDLAPTLFKGADVIKSIMASNITGGISAIVNLKTHRPFDFKEGWTFSGTAQGNWGDRTKKLNKEGSLLVNYRTDRWGVMLTGSYSKETIENATPQISAFGLGEETTEKDVGFDFNGDGVVGDSLDPNKVPKDYYYQWDPKAISTQTTQRERKGLDGAFEYKFNDSLELIGDVMYTKMDETDTTHQVSLQDNYIPGFLLPDPAPVISPQGVLLKGVNAFNQNVSHSVLSFGPIKSLNTNLELRFDNGGLFSGSLRWVHGTAHQHNTMGDIYASPAVGDVVPLPDGTSALDNPQGLTSVRVGQDYSGKYPSLHFLDDVTNPARWVVESADATASKLDANLNVFRADGTLNFNSGVLDSFQFGARYEKQSEAYDSYWYETPVTPAGGCANMQGPGPHDAYYHYLDPRIVDACTGFSEISPLRMSEMPSGWLENFNGFDPIQVSGVGNGLLFVNPEVMRDPVGFLHTLAPNASGAPTAFPAPANSWRVDKKAESIYGQFNLSGQLGSMPWTSNIGVNLVRTTFYIQSFVTNSTDFIGNGGKWDGVYISHGVQVTPSSYTRGLPAFNVALNITPDQVLRFAANKTQARQNLATLGRGLVLGYQVNGNPPRDPSLPADTQLFTNASSGNPKLQPYRSTNYDLSYAWYFAPHSIAYLGAFFMDVSSFPESTVETVQEPDSDGVVRRSGPLFTTVNGGGSIIRGLEGQFRTQFAELPSWWSGFGVNLNYTFLRSSNPLAAGARQTYNAVLFYQKYGLQVRLAYNWHGRILDLVNQNLPDVLNVYSKPQGYLDASVEYRINPNVSVFLQGTNLTDAYDPAFVQYPNAFWSENISERRYFAGVRLNF